MKRCYILGMLVICIFISCARPLITNTHQGAYEYSTITDKFQLPIENSIGVVAAAIPTAEAKVESTRSIFDFDTLSRKTLLEIYAKKAKTNEEIIALIKTPLSNKAPATPKTFQVDYSKIMVRLFFSNTKVYNRTGNYVHDNTRLAYLNTKVSIDSVSPVFIYSIDRLENELDAVDMGTLGRKQNVNFGAEINPEFLVANNSNKHSLGNTDKTTHTINDHDTSGNVIASHVRDRSGTGNSEKTSGNGLKINGKASYDNATEITETMNLKFRRLKTGFSFNRNQITISQQGFPLNDISNNTIVTATLTLDNRDTNWVREANVHTLQGELWDDKGAPVRSESVTFRPRLISYIKKNRESLAFKLFGNFEGLLRAVGNSVSSNNLEYDDKVHYYNFSGIIAPIVLDLNQYAKRVYRVVYEDKQGVFYDLYVHSASGENKPLLLFEGDNYPEVLFWLNKLVKAEDLNLLKANNKYLYLKSRKACSDCAVTIRVVGDITPGDMVALKKIFVTGNGFLTVDEIK